MQRQRHPNGSPNHSLSSALDAVQITAGTILAALILASGAFNKPNTALRHQTNMTVLQGFLPALEFARTNDASTANESLTLDTVSINSQLALTTVEPAQDFTTSDAYAF